MLDCFKSLIGLEKKIPNGDTECILSRFGFEFSRTQFNTKKQKASEDQFTLDDYQRLISKPRSAVGQAVVHLVKSYLHRYSQTYSIQEEESVNISTVS
ncbi:hypothetical protein AYI70_g8273 [Smittium culicis]|uniref:Uncharacterized protein n=1 Tax=Smittium culicis TaxID=133412 RepID=A0A1R1XGR9_9FUNG|nr:hypothetical protein AYI70_g8273 [Smittium culicis]